MERGSGGLGKGSGSGSGRVGVLVEKDCAGAMIVGAVV